MSNQGSAGPFGGWFGTIGLVVGFFYGANIAEWPGAIGGAFICAALGLAIEHILARIILIAMLIFMMAAQKAFFSGVREALFSGVIHSPAELYASAPYNHLIGCLELAACLGQYS